MTIPVVFTIWEVKGNILNNLGRYWMKTINRSAFFVFAAVVPFNNGMNTQITTCKGKSHSFVTFYTNYTSDNDIFASVPSGFVTNKLQTLDKRQRLHTNWSPPQVKRACALCIPMSWPFPAHWTKAISTKSADLCNSTSRMSQSGGNAETLRLMILTHGLCVNQNHWVPSLELKIKERYTLRKNGTCQIQQMKLLESVIIDYLGRWQVIR